MQTQTTAATVGQILKSLVELPPQLPTFQNSPTTPAPADPNQHCRHCQGLDHCQYPSHRGYKVTDNALAQCHHLTTWKAKRRRDNLFIASGIPPQYSNLTLQNCHLNRTLLHTVKAAVQQCQSIYIHGATGTGKTYLLSLIGNLHIALNRRVKYTTAAEMLLKLRYTATECEARLKEYQTSPILLLDDLGKERRSDYGEEQLYMVLEGRQRHGNATVIASRFSQSELPTRYTEQINAKINRIERGMEI